MIADLLHKPLNTWHYFHQRIAMGQKAASEPFFPAIGLKFDRARSLVQLMENNVRNSQDV